MNDAYRDAPTKALEFAHQACLVVLVSTLALLAWVASGVEFSNQGLRLAAMACLTLSVVYGVATVSLIPLIQESRRPGQSNFDVEGRFELFGPRAARLKTMLLPQYLLLIGGVVLYAVGMID